MARGILITTSGCKIVERRLRAVARLANDFSPAWDDVVPIITDGIANAFQREGPGWAENDPGTLRGKRGNKILRDTGRLERSLTSNPKTRKTRNSLDIVTSVPYAEVSFGGSSTQPPRPLEITEHYKRQVSKRMSERLVEEYDRS